MELAIKRIYDDADPDPGDGFRILVDRLRPRGVSKQLASLDLWLKEIAPSAELRKWFDHRVDRFPEFSIRYKEELAHNAAIDDLRKIMDANPKVTLVYGARNAEINQAVVLAEFLRT